VGPSTIPPGSIEPPRFWTVSNEITGRIANSLNATLIRAEANRPTEHPDARDYTLRGRAVGNASHSRNSYAEAIDLYERALALDPQSVEVKLRLVSTITNRMLDGMSNTTTADFARAEGLLGQALAVENNSQRAHSAKANLLRAQGRYADAIPEYETIIVLNRNSPSAYANLGQCKLLTGSLEEVILLVERAIRLSPRDPGLGYYYLLIARVHQMQPRTDEAVTLHSN
jgi:adenylate cyclase